jgi:hypothetical protein
MGPPPFGQPAERPPRPATVTAAAGLMLVQVVLSLLGAIIAVSNRDLIADAAEAQATEAGGADVNTDTIITVALFFAVGLAMVIAIVFVVLALFNLRGSNAARITTWVVCGLFLCCSGFGIFGNLRDAEYVPTWYTAYSMISVVLSLLIYIGVIVLLLLPASNNFFKPRQQGQVY